MCFKIVAAWNCNSRPFLEEGGSLVEVLLELGLKIVDPQGRRFLTLAVFGDWSLPCGVEVEGALRVRSRFGRQRVGRPRPPPFSACRSGPFEVDLHMTI